VRALMLNAGVGFVAGLIGTTAWEWFLKPRRERRNVARLLDGEVEINLKRLVWAKISLGQLYAFDQDLELSTVTFAALGDTISQLPPKVLKKVIHLYFEIGHVTNLHRQYLSINDKIGATKRGGKQKNVKVGDELLPEGVAYLNLIIEVLNGTVERTISELQEVHADLSKFSAHWIKWKRWKAPTVEPVDYPREAELLAKQQAHNAQLMLGLIEKQKGEGNAP
jgi:hypothetical protein